VLSNLLNELEVIDEIPEIEINNLWKLKGNVLNRAYQNGFN
jgi:hypothetical protein